MLYTQAKNRYLNLQIVVSKIVTETIDLFDKSITMNDFYQNMQFYEITNSFVDNWGIMYLTLGSNSRAVFSSYYAGSAWHLPMQIQACSPGERILWSS